jgi:hypothetical protein
MAQSGFTPIQLYRSTTAAAVPTAGNLVAGELAINLTDEKLYFENASGVVKVLADSTYVGTVTSVNASGGTTGMTFSGGPITSSGTLTLAGTLAVANGGTGTATAFTAGSVVFAGASGVYSQDNANLFWDNTNDRLGIGTTSPAQKLHVNGNALLGGSPAAQYSNVTISGDAAIQSAAPLLNFVNAAGSTRFGYLYHTGSGGNIELLNQQAGAITFGTNNAERMRIDSSGNVGIGTSSPATRLHVAGTGSGPTLRLENQTASTGKTYDIISGDGGPLRFQDITAGAERMRIASDGNVGIGTTSPLYQATVLGLGQETAALTDAGNKGGSIYLQATGVTAGSGGAVLFGTNFGNATPFAAIKGLVTDGANNTIGDLAFSTRNAVVDTALSERMRITTAGNVGIGTSSPAANLEVSQATTATPAIKIMATSGATPSLVIADTLGSCAIAGSSTLFLRAGGTGAAANKVYVLSSGNVGIGAASPPERLSVNGNIRLENNNNIYWGGTANYITGSSVSNAITFYTTSIDRMRIDSNGNVGIGTSVPGYKLDVNGTGYFNSSVQFFPQDGFRFTSVSAVSAMRFGSATAGESTAEWAYNRATAATTLSVGNTGSALNERMRIDASGNVGIGTATPTGRLEVSQVTTATAAIQITSTGGFNPYLAFTDSLGTAAIAGGTSGTLLLRAGGAGAGDNKVYVLSSGNVGIGAASPSERLTVSGNIRLPDNNNIYWGGTANYITGSNASNFLAFGTNGAEDMRITSAGNVGIGTSAPQGLLHVVAGTDNSILVRGPVNLGTGGSIYAVNSANSAITPLEFGASVYSFAGGNVGIGTTAPSYKLQINAASGGNQVAYFINDSVGSTLAGISASINGGGNNTNSYHFVGVTQTVALWYLYGNGTTSYTSDIRVKKNVTTTRDGYLEDVCKLRVVKYNWYNDSDDTPRELGFIAQEVEQVFPGLVQDAMHPTKDGEIHKVLKGSVMMPIMLKALQEASAKIDALTARVAQLEGN